MKKPSRARPARLAAADCDARLIRRLAALTTLVLLIAALLAGRADATAALCESCNADNGRRQIDRIALPALIDEAADDMHRAAFSDQELATFSGVGLMVCTAGDVSRSSTAFLVGAFDIAVTVAHTFEVAGSEPTRCVYNSIDATGQIRERIPVAYVKSQWALEPDAAGRIAKDLAVARLSEPSRYAHRTMPLGRYSGAATSVVMVGFKELAHADTFRHKKNGRVYGATFEAVDTTPGAFTHDMDSLEITAGAPVMDERTGIIIGIHTRLGQRGNAMITMNDWLEATIRAELKTGSPEPAARAD